MKHRILMIVLLISLFTVGCSNTSTNILSEEEKLADFEQLYNEVKEGYPFLEVNKRLNNVDWLSKKEAFNKKIINTSSDQEFADELNNIMGELNNNHTSIINDKDKFNEIKEIYERFGWYDFFDDSNVNNMYDSLKNEKKNADDNFQDIQLKDLVKNKIGYISISQMNSANGSIDDDMKRIESYLNKINGYKSLVIDIRGNYGGTDEYWIELVSLLSDKDYKCGGYKLFRNNSNIINNYTKLRKVKLNDINKLPEDVVNNAPKEIKSLFTNFEYNELVVKGKSKKTFKGNIYLLVDKHVFSGAESFSIFCKEQNFATIIGSKTGGDGYIYDPVLFKLNNSGLIVRMSSTMYLTESGICDEEDKVTPHIEVKNTSRSNVSDQDECIREVLKLENK